ncbi:MAG: response regulator [Betaproteobacteria bacterium]|nr:response regulator [Betaproteobacteria bacterium]
MSDLPLLYVADADAAFRATVEQTFSADFDVRGFSDGIACASRLSEIQPAILLLSANLPDAPGIELCRDIRGDGQLHDTHVVLLLGNDATQATVDEAHAAGCDEALTHPVDLPNLLRHLRTTHRLASERSSFRQQANYAQKVAMTAMTSMGELGMVLQFLSKCFSCATLREVAQEVLITLKHYDLAGAVQVRSPQETLTESTTGDSSREYSVIIEKLYGIGRIFEFKTRMVINYPHVSILMSHVPDDAEVRGRIRDNVAMLAEGAEARVASLLIELDNRRKQDGIRYALGEILGMTEELREHQRVSQELGKQAVSVVIERFETAFVRCGLTSAQESELIGLLESLRQEVAGVGLTADEVDRKLQSVTRSLQSIAEEQL